MDIDEKIKQELLRDTEVVDELMRDQQGMLGLFGQSFKGGAMSRWMVLVTIMIFVVSGFMIWSAYEFMTALTLENRLFWGVWFIITLNAQGAMKLWTWMEANRNSVVREVKRVEIELARLRTHLEGAS